MGRRKAWLAAFDQRTVVHTIPGEQVFRPMAEGGCPMVR
jgi:hypothetical protein